jgi:tRNA threonylcarbamoyladenosine biosynthesis protein TsaE
MEIVTKSLGDTRKAAYDFAGMLAPKGDKATVVGLYGELGSGKTTFMKYLAEFFGIEETVQSPTFVIMKIYKTSLPRGRMSSSPPLLYKERGQGGEVVLHLIHIDAYRIEKEDEMLNLGWHEIIADSKNLVFVEWPEKVSRIMPEHIRIFFYHVSENERKITIET